MKNSKLYYFFMDGAEVRDRTKAVGDPQVKDHGKRN